VPSLPSLSFSNTHTQQASGEVVSDAVTAIRTVSAFNLQRPVLSLFDDTLIEPLAAGIRRGFIQASFFGKFVSAIFREVETKVVVLLDTKTTNHL
jgi:hypothetical protein